MLRGLIKPAPCLIEMLDRMTDMTTAKKYYYAATFPYGRNTTTGEPNKRTFRMSKACYFFAFTSKHERDDFVADNESDRAEAFTRAGLRGLRLGTSVSNFNMDVECAELDADNRG